MKFSTTAVSQLHPLPIVDLRSIESIELDVCGGKTPPVSPHDLGNGITPFYHLYKSGGWSSFTLPFGSVPVRFVHHKK
jgi:hypothetical protein